MDLKQLQYFVVCAQTGSFSDAAKVLYSTQPSVSKVVKALEDALGMQLFERLPRGIRLTVQGQKVYRYACRITNEIDALENMASHGMTKWIRVSLNPSSWFANQFVDFYNETYEKNYHFQLTTAGVRSVMDRVRDYVDDIGFVYILSQQKENFLHEISRNKLQFVPMYETDVVFYPGKETELYDSGKSKVELKDLDGVRFIQNYQDEYISIENSAEENVLSWRELDVAVVTNSDYIMDKMLKSSDLVNLSGSYLSEDQAANYGKRLALPHNQIRFGYVMRKEEQLDEGVWELIRYLERQLRKNPQDDDLAI